MSKAAVVSQNGHRSLPGLIRLAADALAGATTAAEVLEARDRASAAYDEARRMARITKARRAHDDIIAAVHRAQADALEIEAAAKRRLADEYDAAQGRGEVGKRGQRTDIVPAGNKVATAEDVGLSRKQVFEARQVRDAVAAEPGIVRQALDGMLASRAEPTRAALKRAIAPTVSARPNLRAAVGTDTATAAERGNNLYETPPEAMRVLLALESFGKKVKEPACGKGAISRRLEDAGYEVDLADLVDYGTHDRHGELQRVEDFRSTEAGQGDADVVTNPPYGGVLNSFVAHALRVHRPRKMALLLNLNFLCGFDDPDRNFVMDECPPSRVHVFSRRLPMMHRDGWTGPEANSRMNTAWFVWERGPDGTYGGQTVVRRHDWKNFETAKPLRPEKAKRRKARAA